MDHPVVLSIFADLCEKYGYSYVMGNDALETQMRIYLAQTSGRNKPKGNLSSKPSLNEWTENWFAESIKKLSCTNDRPVEKSTFSV